MLWYSKGYIIRHTPKRRVYIYIRVHVPPHREGEREINPLLDEELFRATLVYCSYIPRAQLLHHAQGELSPHHRGENSL